MKRSEKIAAIAISATTLLIVYAIFVWYITSLGCGCITSHVTMSHTVNSTGSYVNVTFAKSDGNHEVQDLKMIFYDGDNKTYQYVNGSLVPGASYLFKLNDTNATYVMGTVREDDKEMVVVANDL